MPRNPFATSRTMPEVAVPAGDPVLSNRYAVPTNVDAPYTDTFGWAPTMRTSNNGVPDRSRLGLDRPRVPTQGNPLDPPEVFWRTMDADDARRASVEHVNAIGFRETKDLPGYPNPHGHRFAPNPREVPPPENRVTQAMAPRTYTFTRPFDKDTPKNFNGLHFSMASNKRTYEIYGMAPVHHFRNTYRLSPEPWDTDIVDLPPAGSAAAAVPDARATGVDVPYPSRSWRL